METNMQRTFKANEIEIGYRPSGFKIDRTASPMDRYTRCDIDGKGNWHNCVPVRFDEMPTDGWINYENKNG